MINLTAHQTNQIRQHTLACYPEEMCGILTDDSFIALKNISNTPEKSFSFDPLEYTRVVEITKAIVHSHCKSPKDSVQYDLRTPSIADIKNQICSNKPWLIVGTEGENVSLPIQFPREPNNIYIGRPFMWYINDCYNLVEDYYKFTLGIELPPKDINFDYSKPRQLINAFSKYVKDYGFVDIYRIEDIRKGDLLLLDRFGISESHLGIYENGYVLHQKEISCREPLSNFIGNIKRILRLDNVN